VALVQVTVVRLRNYGKAVPRWQLSTLKPVSGELRIEEGRSEYLTRFMRTARLLDFSLQRLDALPPLLDASVLWLKPGSMAITGFEQIEDVDYAQTWLVALPQSV